VHLQVCINTWLESYGPQMLGHYEAKGSWSELSDQHATGHVRRCTISQPVSPDGLRRNRVRGAIGHYVSYDADVPSGAVIVLLSPLIDFKALPF
jgi:hypothetical protein